MTDRGRLQGAFILSVLLPLAACSEADVQFPPGDGGGGASGAAGAGGGGADASPDVTVDRGDPDVSPDMSVDTRQDADARIDGLPDRTDADGLPPDSDDGHDGDDATSEPDAASPDDATDAHDATSEDADTCESHCASGVCDMNGECKPCVQDSECKGGNVCNAGVCGPRCGDGGTTCSGSLQCCNEHCVDTTRDPRHCGACGTTCSATQFCGTAATPVCTNNVISNICNTKKATFLLDGLPDDDGASNVLRAAVAMYCSPVPTLVSVDQTMSPAINTMTGQPLAGGGELLVAAGGDSTQLLARFLEQSGTSSVYNESDGATSIRFRRRGGAADGGDAVIVDVPLATITLTHDYFLVEIVKEPITGTLSLKVYGVDSPGTKAGAYYFANQILPNVMTFNKSWYLYEWTAGAGDAGGDGGPSAGDTFTLVASAP